MKSKLLTLLVFASAAASSYADRPDPAQFQAAIANCENISSNLNSDGSKKVTLPVPAQGQRPTPPTAEQMQLLQACQSAGILPKFEGGRRGPPPGGQQGSFNGQQGGGELAGAGAAR